MTKVTHNNIFFNLNQYKIFHLVEYQISNDDPVRMFAIILYAYFRGIYSTRDIKACHENIKFRFLLQDSKIPDHSTISRFLTKIEAYANKYTFVWRGSIEKNTV